MSPFFWLGSCLGINGLGRYPGRSAAGDAEYDIAVEQYKQAVASAMREVVVSINRVRALGGGIEAPPALTPVK